MKKIVRESIAYSKSASFAIQDLCDGKITWEDIEPYVSKRGVLPDPGFYSNKKAENAEDLAKYLEQFQERFGCEGELTFNEWDFASIKDNKKYTEAAINTSNAVGYGKGRYMGD